MRRLTIAVAVAVLSYGGLTLSQRSSCAQKGGHPELAKHAFRFGLVLGCCRWLVGRAIVAVGWRSVLLK
jgi:hypothetical protein